MELSENPEPEQPVKKDRSRKKQLYQDIRKQMEFYFSDSNLTKDRFISKKFNENGCVDLALFLTFNKIRLLTSDLNDLVKALRRSEFLQVSEDNMTVKRLTPIHQKENEDDYSIYVEQLPPETDHDWMREVFSSYGKIDYISLPKFRNGKLKGFGFVEFASTESVEAIVKDYKKAGCYLSTEMVPDALCSVNVKRQELESNENSKQGKTKNSNLNSKREFEDEKIVEDKSSNTVEGTPVKIKKRKKLECDDSPLKDKNNTLDQPENVKKKKSKRDNLPEEGQDLNVENGQEDIEDKCVATKKKHEKSVTKDDQSGEALEERNIDDTVNVTDQPEQKLDGNSGGEECEMNEEVKKKKNRKKKKKPKKLKITAENSGLQILSKRDWKRLRNKYLNTQRERMKLLKKHLSQQQFRADKLSLEKEKVGSAGLPADFTPGIIVKVILPEPVIDVKRFKDEAKASSNVKYIDVKEGVSQVYFRFGSAEEADKFKDSTEWSDVQIIGGEEETQYWQKIQTDRTEKLQKSKKFKERGKTKLVKKAEKALGKHIVFEGLDNE